MLSSSLYTLLKVSKATCPQKLFAYDCVTLYINMNNSVWRYINYATIKEWKLYQIVLLFILYFMI